MSVRRIVFAVAAVLALGLVAGALLGSAAVVMPGRSHRGPLAELTDDQRALASELRRDVVRLATEIGERNTRRPSGLDAARALIRAELERASYAVEEEAWMEVGVECANLVAERRGTTSPGEIVLIGAHYDTVPYCPGANDNGTGVAALLAIARRLSQASPAKTLRLVAFANEEPPYFATASMGSARHAARCRKRGENVVVMLSLETIGYYSDRANSQDFPAPGLGLIYPTTGNFLSFVGNFASRSRVRDAVRVFREQASFPCEGAALPSVVPGVGWSDQLFFWKHGYSALMATDTAPFRYPHYHTSEDTPDKLDFERFARVTGGLERVVSEWAGVSR